MQNDNNETQLSVYGEVNNNNKERQKDILLKYGVYLDDYYKEALIWYNDQTNEYKKNLLELYLLPQSIDEFQRELYKEDDNKDEHRNNIFAYFTKNNRPDSYYLTIRYLDNTTIIEIEPYLLIILKEKSKNKIII